MIIENREEEAVVLEVGVDVILVAVVDSTEYLPWEQAVQEVAWMLVPYVPLGQGKQLEIVKDLEEE